MRSLASHSCRQANHDHSMGAELPARVAAVLHKQLGC